MGSGEKAIACGVTLAVGCATIADLAVTSGALTLVGGGFQVLEWVKDAAARKALETEIERVRKSVHDGLVGLAAERGLGSVVVDVVYLRLDKILPRAMPDQETLQKAGFAPREIGRLVLLELKEIDSRFETEPFWGEIARVIVEGAFEAAFSNPRFYEMQRPAIDQEVLRRLGILADGVGRVETKLDYGFAAVMAKLEEMRALQGGAPADPRPLEDQLRALFQSNDVEAQKALAAGVPGDGLEALAALNERRIRHIHDLDSALAIERLQAARSCRAAGAAQAFLRRVGAAIDSYERARALEPDDFWTQVELRRLYMAAGRLADASQAADAALGLALTNRDRSVALNETGDVRVAQGDLKGALDAYEKSRVIAERLAADDSNAEAQRDLSVSLNKIGDVRVAQGDLKGALDAYEKSRVIRERLAADDSNAEAQRDLSVSLNKIGDVRVAQGDLKGALDAYEKSRVIAERLAADDSNAGAQRDLSVSLERIGDVLALLNDLDGAIAHYERSLPIAEALARRDPSHAQWQEDVRITRARLAALKATRT